MRSIAHKIQLSPNNKQKTHFKKACGVSRLSWNWGVGEWNEQYKAGGRPSGMSLKKQFNAIKKETYPFIFETTKYACQQPFIDLQKSWNRFFKGLGGKPNFKKKGKCKDSFYVGGDQIKVSGNYVHIPKLGKVKMRENLRFEGKINSVSISRTADKWLASFSMEAPDKADVCENQTSVGIDLGLNAFATLSNGVAVAAPKPLKKKLKKLKRLSRQLSRKQKGSKNRHKAKNKLAQLYANIANIRKDFTHKFTSCIAANFGHVAIEDLNVKGMTQNKRLARSISDVGWYETRRQLSYKLAWNKSSLHVADRWFASSKTCSECGNKKEKLTLSTRTYECANCGMIKDRDHNAAQNLKKQIPGAYGELTPVDMTALLSRSGITTATSMVEAGTQRQNLTISSFG